MRTRRMIIQFDVKERPSIVAVDVKGNVERPHE